MVRTCGIMSMHVGSSIVNGAGYETVCGSSTLVNPCTFDLFLRRKFRTSYVGCSIYVDRFVKRRSSRIYSPMIVKNIFTLFLCEML